MLGVKLPEAYVSLMKRNNGGYIPQHLVKVEAPVPQEFRYYLSDGFVSIGSIASLSMNQHRPVSIANTLYLVEEWGLPSGLVLLDGDGHTWVALDYRRAKENPPVIFLLTVGGRHIHVAADFADLVARMIPYEAIYDADGNLKA